MWLLLKSRMKTIFKVPTKNKKNKKKANLETTTGTYNYLSIIIFVGRWLSSGKPW